MEDGGGRGGGGAGLSGGLAAGHVQVPCREGRGGAGREGQEERQPDETAEAGEASIVAYNLVGEQIINDNLGTLPAGEHNHILNFNGVSAGVYLVTLNAGGETTTMRVTLK